MKKLRILSGLLMAALFVELLLWQLPDKHAKESAAEPVGRYVYIAPYGQIEFRELAAHGILQADEEFQTETELWTYADLKDMSDIIYRSIYAACDGIILFTIDYSKEVAEAVHAARKAGIEVVIIDSKVDGLEYDHYLGIDNYSAGEIAAELLGQTGNGVKEKKAVVIISRESAENQMERVNGFTDTWEAVNGPGTVEVIETQEEYMFLLEKLINLKEGGQPIRYFFCAEASSSVYLQDALTVCDYTDAQVVGFDMLRQILEYVEIGAYQAVIGQNMMEIGYRSVQYLQSSVKEADGDTDEIIEVNVIDAANVSEYLNEDTEELVWNTM